MPEQKARDDAGDDRVPRMHRTGSSILALPTILSGWTLFDRRRQCRTTQDNVVKKMRFTVY
jgi:hypothetical protein